MVEAKHSVFQMAGRTHPGLRRRHRPNEDAFLILAEEEQAPPLLVVADGMGGHKGGTLASRLVVESLAGYYRRREQDMSWARWMEEAIRRAHEQIRLQGQEQGLPEMGSTVVAALLFPDHILVANVGDSRAYLLQGQRLRQVSQDHSVVAQMVREGRLNPQEALRHPHRHRLTQSLSARRPAVQPYFQRVSWGPGDQLLLCSDGLWEVVPESLIREVLSEAPPPESTRRLVELANRFSGPDNITVVVAWYRSASVRESRPSRTDDEETRP